MASVNKNTGQSKSVDAIVYRNKRINVPTADAALAFGYEPDTRQILYPRDTTLDPQLVWRGKDTEDQQDLFVDAPPIYQQEKIDPRVLIENFRDSINSADRRTEPTLFDSFDGLDEFDSVDFYKHEAKWSNRMILGDSLQVMASLSERERLRGQVQMVYIDPPYGIKFGSNWQVSARNRDVKDGKLEHVVREVEQVKAFRDTWQLGIHSYLAYLRDRLTVARDLLTESGSCFVQIGDENVHLVRSLMDEVFGSENFIATLSYKSKKMPLGETFIFTAYDHVLWYAKKRTAAKFHRLYKQRQLGVGSAFSYVMESTGNARRATVEELKGEKALAAGAELFQSLDLVSAGRTESCVFNFEFAGTTLSPGRGKSWKTNREGMERLIAAGRVVQLGKVPRYALMLSDYPVQEIENVWTDTQGASEKLYVVQTTDRIIQRCMTMCTDPGDLVLDPTCGSGTTAYVAEQWGRRWITIDTSRVALALARQRIMGACFPWYVLADTPEGRALSVSGPTPSSALDGNEFGSNIRYGFAYKRVPHVTLGAISTNPDIKPGMSREAIKAVVAQHAESETLYDQPYEDPAKVRVSGPFTVESLSPHRAVAFADRNVEESRSEVEAAKDGLSQTFEQSIIENLRKAGIQNGARDERITFASLDAYAGLCIQAIGERVQQDGSEGNSRSGIAIAIGPQYGTISPAFVKAAAREAVNADDVGVLCVLGFAFDSRAVEATKIDNVDIEPSFSGFASVADERRLGRLRVLLVRMNMDLLMGESLKKTQAANLFTVFGEPDCKLNYFDDGTMSVEVLGIDVFDPTTGELRSNDTGQVALWMIDTNYNDEAFFVRQCYFTGQNDPLKKLKEALRADINLDQWVQLYGASSVPFRRPATGKIAIKVINDYGDEVTKVYAVQKE